MPYCAQCGTQITESSNFCNTCGTPVAARKNVDANSFGTAVQTAPITQPVIAPPDAEHTFFQEGGVSVTNKRFIVPSQTYAMAGVTSVAFAEIPPKRGWAIFFAFVGLVMLAIASETRVLGGIILIVAVVVAVMIKADYAVALRTAGGEVHATSSKDGDFIRRIVDAINNAIVYRQ